MTKSEFEYRIDAIMEKHGARIDYKFDKIDAKLKQDKQWIIGTILAVGSAIFIALITMSH